MIRKIIIVLLTLGAVGSACACGVSYAVVAGVKRYTFASSVSAELGSGHLFVRVVSNRPAMAGQLVHEERTYYDALSAELNELGSGVEYYLWTAPPRENWLALVPHIGWMTTPNGGATEYHVWFSTWLFTFSLALYPALAFIRGPLRRYRRRKRGLCVGCGYDLRGSPERCPECGSEKSA